MSRASFLGVVSHPGVLPRRSGFGRGFDNELAENQPIPKPPSGLIVFPQKRPGSFLAGLMALVVDGNATVATVKMMLQDKYPTLDMFRRDKINLIGARRFRTAFIHNAEASPDEKVKWGVMKDDERMVQCVRNGDVVFVQFKTAEGVEGLPFTVSIRVTGG